ncbi:MAG TPA: LiaF domain-containing protein [Gemmatimonadaceae bacterium]|nr:LiaF domain-containing protein [Gemmatimonadaceae bacterium]
MRTALSVVVAGAAFAAPLSAQNWRSLDVARQLSDSNAAAVQVVYGTGKFGLQGTSNPLLYHMQLTYDAARSQPRHTFDASTRKLQLGVEKSDVRFTGRNDSESGKLQLELSRATPIDLTLDLGAVEADLDLTGLKLSRLNLESGASDGRLRFDSLNATPMSVLQVSLGAASFRGERLANANARDIRVDAGVGNVELDLSGQWTQDIDLRVEVTLGVVTVHVPSDVGVRVNVKKTIASFDHEGLIERDGAWVSPNWDSATHKLRISAETVFGKLTIDKTGR